MEVLNFHFQDHSYCLEISRVSEILNTAKVLALPGAPPAFDGIFQVRGRIVNLLNFCRCFGEENSGEPSSIVVLAGDLNQFALRVPDPVEVKSLDFNNTQFPENAGGVVRILHGTTSDGVEIHHLISPDRLLSYTAEVIDAWRCA
jgi:Chemotaxis signal transduction protein